MDKLDFNSIVVAFGFSAMIYGLYMWIIDAPRKKMLERINDIEGSILDINSIITERHIDTKIRLEALKKKIDYLDKSDSETKEKIFDMGLYLTELKNKKD